MRINRKAFFPAVVILTLVIIAVAINLETVQNSVGAIYDACIENFGWLFVIADLSCLVFSLWIMFGPYKDLRLGGEDCKPAFSTFSWAGMMFTTSCGAWLVVYGFLEPIYCSAQAPFQIAPLSTQAYEIGQAYAHFHWGPNAWCIYVPVSVAIGYVLHNRKESTGNISSVCGHFLKSKFGNIVGYAADVIAICSAVIAPVISIGAGMPLLIKLSQTIFNITGVSENTLEMAILAIWIMIFGTSVYLGLQNGIKNLSNTNIVIAFIVMFMVGIFVSLTKVFSAEINTLGVFLTNFVRMSTYTDPYGNGAFVRGWTVSYWACYFVYMPLMGVFNAKISKGRRLKEIAFGQLVMCSLGCWVAMGTFGNYAMKAQVSNSVDVAGFLSTGDEAGAVIALLETMPASKIMMVLILGILFIFLATTMDSSAFTAAEMTVRISNEDVFAPRWLRIFWAVLAAVIAFILLQLGGVKAVRSLCYLMGLPLAIISFLILASTIKMIREDHAEECESKKPLTIFKRK